MNKKILLFTFILFFNCKAESRDYVDYFQKINTAESLIADSQYEKAYNTYDEVMKSYPLHFYKELHNACICALKLERYKEAYSFACDLVGHGYELKDFESTPL